MKEEQGSWGTNGARNTDSPPEDVSCDDDPDFTDGPSKKKKYTYRKEVQRNYRERIKIKKADVEAALDETRQELRVLATNNRYLQDNQQALELLNIEGAQLANILSNTEAQAALSKKAALPPSADLYQLAESLLEYIFTGGRVDAEQIRYYVLMPPSVLIKTEAMFLNKLDSLMAEWKVCYSTRDKIEHRLSQALQTRIRVALLLPVLKPETHLQLLNPKVQPLPGTSSGDEAKKLLISTMEGLELGLEHKAAMKNALRDYREGVACLRAEMAMAQLALCVGPGAVGPFPDPIAGTLPGTMASRMQTSLFTTESASILKQMPYRMVHLYMQLAAAVLEPLSAVQNAKLILGCRPYLPDYLQLCEIISSSGDSSS